MKKFISIAAIIALSTAALSSAQAAEVRVANLTNNAHGVDLWVGDKQIASSVGSAAASSFVDVGSGAQKVVVTEAGTTYPVGVLNLNMDSSSQYTLVLDGDTQLQTRLTSFQTQKVTPQSGQVALRVFNLADLADTASLDVSDVGNLTEESAMAVAVAASSSTLDVSFSGSTVDLTSVTPALDTNTDVFVLNEGYIGNSPNLQTVTITE